MYLVESPTSTDRCGDIGADGRVNTIIEVPEEAILRCGSALYRSCLNVSKPTFLLKTKIS